MITITVVTTTMPTHTVNFDPEQYEYILTTSDGSGEFSARTRQVVDAGIAVEQSDLTDAADLMATEDFNPNLEDALTEVVRDYLQRHGEDASDE